MSPPTATAVPTDDDLVRLALAGSADAHRQIVERYQRPVLALVGRMVRDPSLAEDIAQEAFVRAFHRLASYDPGRKFSSWLFKIAHNRTIDHLRRRHLKTVPLEASDSSGDETWEVFEAPEEEGPGRRAEAAELARALDVALAALRPNYREVLLLRFQGGLAYDEIAEATGRTLATVKVQLHRARKALAKELAARGHAPPEGFSP
ncbi:MAG: sigma-70 family RNA polymerase sigma factor [Acidobacteriota bacterium]